MFTCHSTTSTAVPSLCLPVILPPVRLCPLCVCPSFYHQYIRALFVFARHSTASTAVPSLCLPITQPPVPIHLCPLCLPITLPPVHPRLLCVCPSLYRQYIHAPFALAITLLPVHPCCICLSRHSTASTSMHSLRLPITLPLVHPCPRLFETSHTDNYLSILFSLCIAWTAGARGVAVHGRLQGTQLEPRCQRQHARADQQRGGGADAGGGASRCTQVALVQQPQQFQPTRSTVLH